MASAAGRRWMAARSLLLVMLVGCTAPGGASSSAASSSQETTAPSTRPDTNTSEPTSVTGRPVDPRIAPVSRSSPSAEARQALDACLIPDEKRLDQVIGMGLVPRTTDLYRYIKIPATPNEIQKDSSAWAIALRGEVPQAMSDEIWFDPTCVIIDGEQGWFATGAMQKVLPGGELGPLILSSKLTPGPDLALPPLAP